MHYVVVGAGPAGVIAAETLRKTDPEGKITLIGNEPEPPYSRMAIPYLLMGNIDESGTHLRKSADHYERLGIDIKTDTVDAVKTAGKQLELSSGGKLGYDKLLLATGSRAVLPPVPGVDLPGVHNCWTLADARQIVEQAQSGANVLLIGAGFIGCIVLEALAARGVKLTVVEMGDRMVPRMMNETAGGMIKAWCERQGVRVHTSTQVNSIAEPGGLEAPAAGGIMAFFGALFGNREKAPATATAAAELLVTLSNGELIASDLVISAAGVTPNLELLEGSGIKVGRGVLVNEQLQSSDPDVYAAGDCAQAYDFSTGEPEVHAIQPTASEHGRIAALNMAGRPATYQGSFNMNVLDTLGLISSSFGLWMGVDGGDRTELSDPTSFRYLDLQFRDDVLVGATSLGMTQHVGVLRGLIQSETRLGAWKERLMADPTRVMEAYLDMGLAYR
jgi:NAD(P)H-nitrite reductase large subunit